VDVRMVDANTGRIIFADSGSASKKSVSVRVFGFGGGQRFNEKAATEALRMAIQELAGKISELDLKASATGVGAAAAGSAAKALIADVDGTTITLNKGTNAGFKTGDTVTIKRQGKVIKDPASGKVIKVKYRTVGTVKLTSVEDSYAEGKVVSGSGFQVGDSVK